jgi:hypothetical protein
MITYQIEKDLTTNEFKDVLNKSTLGERRPVDEPERTMKMPAINSRFAKAGVSCFYDSEGLNSSFVHLLKFCAENPHLRQAENR